MGCPLSTMLCVGAHHRMLCEVQRRHPAVNITGTADDTYFNGDERVHAAYECKRTPRVAVPVATGPCPAAAAPPLWPSMKAAKAASLLAASVRTVAAGAATMAAAVTRSSDPIPYAITQLTSQQVPAPGEKPSGLAAPSRRTVDAATRERPQGGLRLRARLKGRMQASSARSGQRLVLSLVQREPGPGTLARARDSVTDSSEQGPGARQKLGGEVLWTAR
jgi:hypothetical protein